MFSEISKKKIKNAGFSLIELIIVVAIMVALVAVLAPNYVKYVKKSRDAVITNAAEEVIQFAKTEFSAGMLSGKAVITVGADETNHIAIKIEEPDLNHPFSYGENSGSSAETSFIDACGGDGSRSSTSDLTYRITIDGTEINSQISIQTETNRTPN